MPFTDMAGTTVVSRGGFACPRQLYDVERQAILEALEFFEGNKRRAAEALGISLKTLYNKLADYGVTTRGLPALDSDGLRSYYDALIDAAHGQALKDQARGYTVDKQQPLYGSFVPA